MKNQNQSLNDTCYPTKILVLTVPCPDNYYGDYSQYYREVKNLEKGLPIALKKMHTRYIAYNPPTPKQLGQAVKIILEHNGCDVGTGLGFWDSSNFSLKNGYRINGRLFLDISDNM